MLKPQNVKPLKKDLGLVDAFGVALNPMVESAWMFSRNGWIRINVWPVFVYFVLRCLHGVIVVVFCLVMFLFAFEASCLLVRCGLTLLRFILAQTDCQGFALELSAWKLQRDCSKIANGLLGDCLRIAFGLQTTCLCIARGLSWDCPETTLGLPRCW